MLKSNIKKSCSRYNKQPPKVVTYNMRSTVLLVCVTHVVVVVRSLTCTRNHHLKKEMIIIIIRPFTKSARFVEARMGALIMATDDQV